MEPCAPGSPLLFNFITVLHQNLHILGSQSHDAMYLCTASAQRVFLSSTNPTPCFGDTVDLVCYYPDVMERVNGRRRYIATSASYRINEEDIFPDEHVFDKGSLNQTASRLRVRIDPAIFTGDPASFTCFLPLIGGGEDSAATVVDPQGSNINTVIDYTSA